MKSHLLSLGCAATLLLASALTPATAQTLLFDFGGGNTTIKGPSPDDPLNAWNNIGTAIGTAVPGTPAAQLNAAVTTGNVATGVNLIMLSRFNGSNENGTQVATVYPLDATRDSLFGNTETFSAGANFFPSFKLTGLTPGDNHNLTFYASRAGVSDSRETLYTVDGAITSTTTLEPANNVNTTTTVSGIKPNAAGEFTITMGPGPNNTNGNHFTYLGVLKVEVVPPQQPVVFSQEPADTTVLTGRPVTFTAAVNSTPPYTIQWKKDNVDIPDANQFSYTIPAAGLDLDNTKYSVTVSNLAFTATSRQATLHVANDLTPPTLVSGTSNGPFHLTVVFSEQVDPISAEDLLNYSVDNGNAFLSAVKLQPDGKTVLITPGQALTGTLPVSVMNVNDLAGVSIAGTATVNVTFPQPDGKSFLLDFGGGDTTEQAGTANDDPLNVWNNIPNSVASVDGGVLGGLVRNDGLATEAGFATVSRFNGVNTNGTLLPSPFPVDATRDSLYGNTEAFNTVENITPIFRLTGLNVAEEHDILFYASRMEVTDNRETRYTVTGATTAFADLNVANNSQNTVSVTAMRPDAEGNITIALTPGPNNNNGNHFTYLGVMKVTPRASTGAPVMLTPVVANGRITLNWSGSGTLEWSTTLTGTWTPYNPAPTSPYSEDIAGQRKFFRVRP
ncbi:MAG: hypothetical protein JWL81_1627 [Verrucomicrobiales bacterium]|nr:hypothetical protein [Verrucomicrobiales bacterium]